MFPFLLILRQLIIDIMYTQNHFEGEPTFDVEVIKNKVNIFDTNIYKIQEIEILFIIRIFCNETVNNAGPFNIREPRVLQTVPYMVRIIPYLTTILYGVRSVFLAV